MEKKKVNKQSRLLRIFILFSIALSLWSFVLFFLQKKSYVNVDLLITGGEWWWATPNPPYWLGNPVTRGAAEYNFEGNKVVEILDVQKFEEPKNKAMVIKARLLVTKNVRTNKYRFKQTPLEIGTTIVISPGNTQMYGNVIGIEGVQDTTQQEKQRITVRWYNVFPWQADAIQVGDTANDGSGREVARILSKEVDLAEKTIITEMSQPFYGTISSQSRSLTLMRTDPLRRDVTLVIEIATTKVGDQNYFGFIQNVKIGESLYISLPTIFINPIIISLSPSL